MIWWDLVAAMSCPVALPHTVIQDTADVPFLIKLLMTLTI